MSDNEESFIHTQNDCTKKRRTEIIHTQNDPILHNNNNNNNSKRYIKSESIFSLLIIYCIYMIKIDQKEIIGKD